MIFEKQILNIYRKNLFIRNDNADGIFYFAPEDFPGLEAHPWSFKARAGHDLKGFFYHYPDPIPGRLLVFDHGMGNGHRAYMREIEQLAKAGFLVFSYDHTGCMASGGENCNGFAQSLSDLDACMEALKAEKALEGYGFSVMGHSWGGFSTMNIAALHPEISHVVSMSGFVSVKRIVEQTFAGPLKPYRKAIMALEREANEKYVDFDAVESLKGTDAKVLLIYSADDPVVKKVSHYDPLVLGLQGKENIRFHLEQGKAHNPSYTAEAVKYKDGFFKALQKLQKRGSKVSAEERKTFMESYDWLRMTAQDEKVWNLIVSHLKA